MNENCSDVRKHITSATINDIREVILNRKTKPVFIITVQCGDETSYEITKEYKDFFDLQCSILDTFPAEAGQTGYDRIIPFLPGRKIFRRNDLPLAQERKPELNKYIKELLNLDKNVSQSKLVLEFFARESDEEIEQNIVVTNMDVKRDDESNQDVTPLQCYVNTSFNCDGEEQSSI